MFNPKTVARFIVPVSGIVAGLATLAAALLAPKIGPEGVAALVLFAATFQGKATAVARALDPSIGKDPVE